jgi:hypothetical protein
VAIEWRSYKISVDPGALWRIQTLAQSEARGTRFLAQPCAFRPSGAAQESNLPTVGLPRPAGFEDGSDLARGTALRAACASLCASLQGRPPDISRAAPSTAATPARDVQLRLVAAPRGGATSLLASPATLECGCEPVELVTHTAEFNDDLRLSQLDVLDDGLDVPLDLGREEPLCCSRSGRAMKPVPTTAPTARPASVCGETSP